MLPSALPEDATREDRAIYRALKILDKRLRKPGPTMCDPLAVERYLHLCLADGDVEKFACLFVNAQHQVIAFEILATGTLDGAAVYPREVVKRALANSAAAVIFAHNHPSGVTKPSVNDRVLTDRLRQALATIDVRVLDHLVVGGRNSPTSFAAHGWL
ncbi:JAB domain-containing protein [Solimonas marina]|nr:JAB domain-containing protein [Solimonas marina]